MKKILIAVLLFMSFQSFAKDTTRITGVDFEFYYKYRFSPPASVLYYTNISSQYKWLSGIFDSTFHVPTFGTTPRIRVRGNQASGAMGMDTVLHKLYYYSDGWREVGIVGWGLTGNASTVDGTNFIGTTDNIPFNIRVNNVMAGRINVDDGHTFYGYLAGQATTSGGDRNVAIGDSAMYANIIGDNNVVIGSEAFKIATSSSNTIAIGYRALGSSMTGANIAIGSQALENNTTGASSNVAIGTNTLRGNASTGNIGIGFSVLGTTGGSSHWNVAIGDASMLTSTGSGLNTAVGGESMRNNTTGHFNTAIGYKALYTNQTGGLNVAVGINSLLVNTADKNTAIGTAAMEANTTGNHNTAVGYDALYLNTTGTNNVAMGWNALAGNVTGTHNIGIGNRAGGFTASVTGTSNIFIGTDAGYSASQLTTSSNSIAIGSGTFTTASNQVVLGNSSITQTKLRGAIYVDDDAGTTGQVLTSNGSGSATWETPSGGSGITINSTAITGGTSGRILFENSSNQVSQTANIAYDATNTALLIGGVTVPDASFDGGFAGSFLAGVTQRFIVVPEGAALGSIPAGARFTSNSGTNLVIAPEFGQGSITTKGVYMVNYNGSGFASVLEYVNGAAAKLNLVKDGGETIVGASTDNGAFTLQNNGAFYTQTVNVAVITATDGDATIAATTGFEILPTISANRNVTFPAQSAGKTITVWNKNSAGFAWDIVGTVIDAADNAITALVNDTMYTFISDGTSWVKKN